MMTAEDCRRKAAECLRAAESASDPNTSQSFRRLSDVWATLAGQIEQDATRHRQSPPAMTRQADLLRPHKIGTAETLHVADILRERLQLTGSSIDEPLDSDISK